jgi:hypothetical protein
MNTSNQEQAPSFGNCSAANALQALWNKSSDKLTIAELEWFSGLSDHAASEAQIISENLEGVACLVNDDNSGFFQDKQNVFNLLSNASSQIKILGELVSISSAADFKLKNQSN